MTNIKEVTSNIFITGVSDIFHCTPDAFLNLNKKFFFTKVHVKLNHLQCCGKVTKLVTKVLLRAHKTVSSCV
jgi:hypothetical protein